MKQHEQERPSDNRERPSKEKGNGFVIRLSGGFILLSICLSCSIAFSVGHISRRNLIININGEFQETYQEELKGINAFATLPNPVLQIGKTPPITTYTSKNFDTKSTTTQSRWMVVTEAGKTECDNNNSENECRAPSYNEGNHSNDDDDMHLPAGQHLLLDIENVDGNFLNSEERLAHAMLELINECGLTLLSYHCHKMVPMGVSCAGVLLESHVSFHTWPKEGVITLDLFTCGPNSLLPIVSLAKRLFSVRKEINGNGGSPAEEPKCVWAYKTRGFVDDSPDNDSAIAEQSDMEYFPVGKMNYKNEIVSAQTKFQEVKVFDVLIPNVQNLESYDKSLHNDGSYEKLHSELFAPDRIVFLDGVLQSRRSGEAAYHETLIHPTLFTHPNPKRVAIIGGGEGASLREVLKHSTVEHVTMIEIDEMMVNISREHLPSWSDCSMLTGSAESCFDDSRVEVIFRDAFQWFIDNFPVDDSPRIAPFDIVIMDALDPQVRKDFVNALYDEGPFLKSIPFALEKQGMFISQVGESVSSDDPPEKLTDDLNRLRLISSLKMLGFTTIRTYTDGAQSGFSNPWQFVAAFKSSDSKSEWLANPSLVDLKIRKRSIPTLDGKSPFNFFDGPTMQTFYFPPKQIEIVYCRDNPDANHCKERHGFDPDRQNLPLWSTLEVKQSTIGEKAGRGVFAKIDIPENSYIGLETLIPSISGDAHTYDLIMKLYDTAESYWGWGAYWGWSLSTYIHGYGEILSHTGRNSFNVDSAVLCFVNHSCDGKYNVGYNLTMTQATADPNEVSQDIREKYEGIESVYNPVVDRQVQFQFYKSAVPLRAIKKGEELFDNYLTMCGKSAEYWKLAVDELRNQCEGKQVGCITEYETYS